MPEFIDTALMRFKLCAEAEADNRKESLDDVEFATGKQWPADIETQRTLDSRPCLTMNRIPQFVRQVTNEYRQQRPSVQVNPVGSGSDPDVAEILQGIVRHIEINSDAEIAYDTAFEQMVIGGFGYYRILTDYIDEDSDDQEIFIKRIKNQFTVYFDPACIEPDYSDARFCFVVQDVPWDEFKQGNPNAQLSQFTELSSIGDQAPGWTSNDKGVQMVRIAEYFYVESEEVKNGKDKRKVFWAKINAVEVMEGNEGKTAGKPIAGKYIPIIPLLGEDIDVSGRRHIAGLVRHIKDPQRMYNYWVSKATESIALAPLAPFIVEEGQIEGHETQWSQANTRMMAVLPYKGVSVGGQQAPPPQRNVYEPPVQAVTLMTKQADNDMKACAGIYDASLGEKGPDQSGRAILARQKQSDVATLNFSDNAARSTRHCGRVLLDLIPKIYDVPRVQRIINPDQTVDHVGVFNSQKVSKEDVMRMQDFQNIKKIYDIGTGRYDVTVSVGPSYQSKRQEAVASQLEFLKLLPPEAAVMYIDLVTANMDWPQAKEFADRARKMLPPQLQDNEDNDAAAQLQQTQAKLQAISQQHEQLTQIVQRQQQIIDTKQVEQQGKTQIAQMQEATRLEIVKMQEATKLAVAQINASKDMNQAFAEREMEQYKLLHGSAHEAAMQSQQHGHESQMADQTAENQSALADQQAQNQMTQQDQQQQFQAQQQAQQGNQ